MLSVLEFCRMNWLRLSGLVVFTLCFPNRISAEPSINVVTTVRFMRDNQNHIFIPVALNGVKSWWAIDTGAPISVIDPKFSAKARAPKILTSSNASVETDLNGHPCPMVLVANLSSGPLNFGTGEIPEVPLEAKGYIRFPEAGRDFEMGGILGMDILSRYNAVLNFRAQEVDFSGIAQSAKDNRPTLAFEAYTAIPLTILPVGRLEVPCSVGGSTYGFIVDTGSTDTICPVKVAKENKIQLDPKTIYAGMLGHHYGPGHFGWVPDFRVADFDCSNTYVEFTNFALPKLGPHQLEECLLGADLLWKYEAVLDVSGMKLYLKSRTKRPE